MKYLLTIFILVITLHLMAAAYPDAASLLQKIDKNMLTHTSKATVTMTVHSARASRTLTSQNWSEGRNKSFSEYLSPPREQGTKMLKLDENLWIYDPSSDRVVQISGNMLRQSVMGSDLSYEDMMEETNLTEGYNGTVTGETTYLDRDCWKVKLTAKLPTLAYPSRLIYVDKERFLPLYEERYAKNGKLLKTTSVQKVQNISGRWYPVQMVYKDALKQGKGTQITINDIQFDIAIPPSIFSKASLRK